MSDSEIEERAWSYFLEASNDDGWISATRHGYAFEKLVELLGEFSKERDEIKVLLESLSKSTSERIKDLRSGHSTQSPKELADALRRQACPHGARKIQFCVVCLEDFIEKVQADARAP